MLAHISDDGTRTETVFEHAASVAKRARLYGAECGLENVAYLTAQFHDFGKNKEEYESYLKQAHENPSSVRRGSVDHSTAGAKYIFNRFYKGDGMHRLTAQLIAVVIASHHGLVDMYDYNGEPYFLNRLSQEEEIHYNEIVKNNEKWLETRQVDVLFEKAVEEVSKMSERFTKLAFDNQTQEIKVEGQSVGETAHHLLGCLERLLLSILIQADRVETATFMNGKPYIEELDGESCQSLWKKWQKHLNDKMGEMDHSGNINGLRQALSRECLSFSVRPPAVYTLEIPTGGGKTLSSLLYALEHANHYHKKRIFYVAPFLSILEQNADEIREKMADDETKSYILEHHSNIIWNQDRDKNKDEAGSYQRLAETWNSPFIMTTMVQLLNTLFSGSTQSVRRFHRLCHSIIIIDEIQTLPVKCVYMFNMMMDFLSRCCDTTVILCSATQPLLGDEHLKMRMLYGNPESMIRNRDDYALKFKRVEIIPSLLPGEYSTDALADFVLDKMDRNILVILNTKKAVRKLYDALSKKVDKSDLVQLTTYMCAEHRSKRIEELKARLDPQKGVKRVICISTQLVEAGVDFSFQCVVRSKAGLDSIAQAAGRCNRNGESDCGRVYIVNYKEENVDSLTEIKQAQLATDHVLYEYKKNPAAFDGDLLSRTAMNCFYTHYFSSRRQEMSYLVHYQGQNKSDSLTEWLSFNMGDYLAYSDRIGRRSPLMFHQAFKRAGRMFEVIGSDTVGLIVPYGEAILKIDELRHLSEEGQLSAIHVKLRELQRFTINVYLNDSLVKELDSRGAIDRSVLNGKVLILRDGFYSHEIGLTDELALNIL